MRAAGDRRARGEVAGGSGRRRALPAEFLV